ncbi:MAG: hypothetical protein HQM16_14315 [Deltaproteobacteria bacterium]|nr:hypothetical protein [Deltaproteobacteria bacterium]
MKIRTRVTAMLRYTGWTTMAISQRGHMDRKQITVNFKDAGVSLHTHPHELSWGNLPLTGELIIEVFDKGPYFKGSLTNNAWKSLIEIAQVAATTWDTTVWLSELDGKKTKRSAHLDPIRVPLFHILESNPSFKESSTEEDQPEDTTPSGKTSDECIKAVFFYIVINKDSLSCHYLGGFDQFIKKSGGIYNNDIVVQSYKNKIK